MSAQVFTAFPGGIVSPAQTEALTVFDAQLVALIVDAKAAGVPQGLIVAVLHGHAHNETQIMIDRAESLIFQGSCLLNLSNPIRLNPAA